ncbi:MAG: adenosylmethionine decarboxylase [Pseudomonadota bacterium]|nr:adenosylmethionine decarboxylase [Pseudomonadota bacterium]
MQGLHLTADLRGCAAGNPAMADAVVLCELCTAAVAAVGLRQVGELFHRFPAPGGITGVVLLAESHVAIHTWPELAAVTLDIYVCNVLHDNRVKAQALLDALETAFAPAQVERHRLPRGRLSLAG